MIKLLAFLGNYEKKYFNTRHNVGFFCSDNLTLTRNLNWQEKFIACYSNFTIPNRTELIHCIKPLTFMNLSGKSVVQVMQFFKLKPEEVLVFHDDLELSVATISLKFSGGLGGHNGLRSIKALTSSQDFWRVRIGIGRPENEAYNIADYVLSKFLPKELENMEKIIPIIDELLLKVLQLESNEEILNLIPKYTKVKPCQ